MNRQEWIKIGYENSWCGPPVCIVHDDIPISFIEGEEMAEGEEPCIEILRLYPDEITRLSVEDNHSPSVWRAHNLGLR